MISGLNRQKTIDLLQGYNSRKKRHYLKSPANSGGLCVTFADLRHIHDNKVYRKISSFYDQKDGTGPRNMEIKLAEMELTMLHGGQISVTYFSDNSFLVKNESTFIATDKFARNVFE